MKKVIEFWDIALISIRWHTDIIIYNCCNEFGTIYQNVLVPVRKWVSVDSTYLKLNEIKIKRIGIIFKDTLIQISNFGYFSLRLNSFPATGNLDHTSLNDNCT